MTERQDIALAMSSLKRGEHYDIHDIENVIQSMWMTLQKRILERSFFLNADAGFDCTALRNVLKNCEVVANVCINKRNGRGNNNINFDEILYRKRYSIEWTNAWMDGFSTILNRFDTTVRNWESWNYFAFLLCC